MHSGLPRVHHMISLISEHCIGSKHTTAHFAMHMSHTMQCQQMVLKDLNPGLILETQRTSVFWLYIQIILFLQKQSSLIAESKAQYFPPFFSECKHQNSWTFRLPCTTTFYFWNYCWVNFALQLIQSSHFEMALHVLRPKYSKILVYLFEAAF